MITQINSIPLHTEMQATVSKTIAYGYCYPMQVFLGTNGSIDETLFMIIRSKLNINSSVTVKYLPKPRKVKTVRGIKYSNRLINDFTNIIERKLAIFVKDI